jgi:hypothetical protein
VWGAAATVFVAAFILDTGAVGRLFWASLAGHAGPWARIVAFGVLLLLTGVTARALYRPARPQPAKARKKATRPPVRNDSPGERVAAIDGSAGAVPTGKIPTGKIPAGKAPAARRRSPRNAGAATDRS